MSIPAGRILSMEETPDVRLLLDERKQLLGEIEKLRQQLKAANEEIRDLRYSGGSDWAQMAADVDYGRGR